MTTRRIDMTELFSPFNMVVPPTNAYPPYNSYKLGTDFFIEMAVAGFSKDELTVDFDGYKLTVSGKKDKKPVDEIVYINRGLAYRNFTQEFHVQGRYEVDGVSLVNGVLVIKLKNVLAEKKVNIEVSDSWPEAWKSKSTDQLLTE